MFTVELYAKIRRAVMVDGLSRREAAQLFGVHRNTIPQEIRAELPASLLIPATKAAAMMAIIQAYSSAFAPRSSRKNLTR